MLKAAATGPAPRYGWDHAAAYLERIFRNKFGMTADTTVADLRVAASNPAMAHRTGPALLEDLATAPTPRTLRRYTMSDGIALAPSGGRRIAGGGIDATLKVAASDGALISTFEVVVPPGFDVGAHVHGEGQEFFYILTGQLDVLAFEPMDRTGDWHEWTSAPGQRFLRGGPGSFLWVPPGTPHAFANPTDEPATMFFQSGAPGGHEHYFEELAALLSADSPPDEAAITDLRQRYDIIQITELHDGR